MKKFYTLCLVLTIITAVSAKLLLSDNASHPVFTATTYDEFVNAALDVPVYVVEMEDGSNPESLLEGEDYIFQILDGETPLHHSEVNVLVVEAGIGFRQYIGSYTQNVTVKEVIQGDGDLEGKSILMANYFGAIPDENGVLMFFSVRGRNIMVPGHRYLVFCEKTEISDYEDIPSYRIPPHHFCCLDLSSDHSAIADINDYTYRNYTGSEFCVIDQELLDVLLIIKHDILEKYYHN